MLKPLIQIALKVRSESMAMRPKHVATNH